MSIYSILISCLTNLEKVIRNSFILLISFYENSDLTSLNFDQEFALNKATVNISQESRLFLLFYCVFDNNFS